MGYYRFTVVLRKGELISKEMYWLLTKKLGLHVQAMAHPETGAAGLNDKPWNVSIKATSCPTNLRKTAFLIIEDIELLLHHQEVHVNWLCMVCYSLDHPTKYCRVGTGGLEESKQKHTMRLEGKSPSRSGDGSRTYGEFTHTTTLERLQEMLQREGDEGVDQQSKERSQHNTDQAPPRPPKRIVQEPVKVVITLPKEWEQHHIPMQPQSNDKSGAGSSSPSDLPPTAERIQITAPNEMPTINQNGNRTGTAT